MRKETLTAKCLRLNDEFETKYNAMIRQLTKSINQQIEAAVERELNAMESALKVSALTARHSLSTPYRFC